MSYSQLPTITSLHARKAFIYVSCTKATSRVEAVKLHEARLPFLLALDQRSLNTNRQLALPSDVRTESWDITRIIQWVYTHSRCTHSEMLPVS